jgi:hypothetical protein
MHNCKEARERFTELVLDGDPRAGKLLDQCEECRAEFESLAATLRMTARLRDTVVPADDYWTGYHAQLRQRLSFHAKAQRLKHAEAKREELKPGLGFIFASLREPLRLCVKTFLLPMPLGLALLAVGLVFAFFAVRTMQQPPAQSQAPVVVHVPVEVPTVQEKVVTRVVYRDRKPVSRPSLRVLPENTFARSQEPLSGFKPTDEVKLTVIKGGSPNEK